MFPFDDVIVFGNDWEWLWKLVLCHLPSDARDAASTLSRRDALCTLRIYCCWCSVPHLPKVSLRHCHCHYHHFIIIIFIIITIIIIIITPAERTPLCKSNGTLFSDIDINELTSVLQKYKTPVTKCCILTCCWVNLVCIRHLIVKIMPEKHAWGPDFLMSDSPYIFQLFKSWLNCAAI